MNDLGPLTGWETIPKVAPGSGDLLPPGEEIPAPAIEAPVEAAIWDTALASVSFESHPNLGACFSLAAIPIADLIEPGSTTTFGVPSLFLGAAFAAWGVKLYRTRGADLKRRPPTLAWR